MSILDSIKSKDLSISFEFFPPKKQEEEPVFFQTVKNLKQFNPSFVSMTYGALGSNQDKSLQMIGKIKKEFNLEVLAHFTCIGTSYESVDNFVHKIDKIGSLNILALRGDIPEGVDTKDIFDDFNYAFDLVKYLKNKSCDMIIGVAGYPEAHIEAVSLDQDLEYLKQKQDAGADFIITQLFFDNNYFYDFCDKAIKMGINIPIIPGIMPVTNYKMIEKITQMCGVHISKEIMNFYSNENLNEQDQRKFAYEYLLKQTNELIDNNISNIHFYTLNKSGVVEQVCNTL